MKIMSNKILTNEMIQEFHDFSTNRHSLSKLPYQAYLYFPSENEKMECDYKNLNKLNRRIFEGGVEYICFEKAKLEELEQEIEFFNKKRPKQKIKFQSNWKEHDYLRFLQATGFDVKKTLLSIIKHLDWQRENLPVTLTDKIMEILNIGFLYIHGRDNRFRPIININVSVYNKNIINYTYEEWCAAIIYFMEYVIKNLLLPGQIENWIIICDVKAVSLLSLPKDFKKFLNLWQNNYRCRLFRMFIINVGNYFNLIWCLIKKMIDENTEEKIKILKDVELIDIFETINKSQIEKKYKGEADDVKNYFFPPFFPSEVYLTHKDNPENIFVNEEEYINRIMFNEHLIASPFINLPIPSISKSSSFKNRNESEIVGKIEKKMLKLMCEQLSIEKSPQNYESWIENINESKNKLNNFQKIKLNDSQREKTKEKMLEVFEEKSIEILEYKDKIITTKTYETNIVLIKNKKDLNRKDIEFSENDIFEINNNEHKIGELQAKSHLDYNYANYLINSNPNIYKRSESNCSRSFQSTPRINDFEKYTFELMKLNNSQCQNIALNKMEKNYYNSSKKLDSDLSIFSFSKIHPKTFEFMNDTSKDQFFNMEKISLENQLESQRRRKCKKLSNSMNVLNLDTERYKTPEFMKKSEMNQNKSSLNGGSQIFNEINAINHRKDEDNFNSEENSFKSIISNRKAKIIKRNKNKIRFSNIPCDITNITNENIDLKANTSDICCSKNVNEKCLIF